MQYLEFVFIIIPTLYILFYRPINKRIKKSHIIILLILILSLHLIFNGYRLQMIPAYIIWLTALVTAFLKTNQKPSIIIRIFKYIGLFIILILAIALPSLFPVFDLPQSTGQYKVGTTDIHLILDRDEIITTNSDTDKRNLMIKVWYPSNAIKGEQDPYVDQGGRHGFAQKYGLPNSAFNYLDKIDTNVYRDVNIANEKFPVLIFSHGYNSKANSYYALLSEIVSQGYIIFAVNHTYESTGTTFPDGTEVYFDYNFAQSIEKDTWHEMEPVIGALKSDLSFEERHPIVKKGLSTYFVKGMVERWAEDISDVVSELEKWNENEIFKGNLDLSNVGVFGHSRGGGAAGESLLIDKRIKAGANVDGVQWGKIVDTVFQKPFLFISADWPEEHLDLNQHAYVNKSNSYFYDSTILKSAHCNFMDIPYMIPVKALSQAGDIDPNLAIEITSKVVTAFFDKHLKNKEIDLNTLNSKYKLLELKTFKGDSIY